jgi:competence protein ComEC
VDTSRRERLAAGVAPALAAGLALPALVASGPVATACAALTLLGLAILLRGRGAIACAVVALAVVLGTFASVAHLRALAADPLAGRIGTELEARAVVTGPVSIGQWDRRAIAHVDGADVLLRGAASFETGDVLDLRGRLRAPDPPDAGGFDERTWLARQGVHEVLRASSITVVGRRGGAWGALDRIRAGARAALHVSGGDGEAVSDGVVLGGDDGLSQGTRDAFRASGLGHLLAVSGQNVVLLIAAVLAVAAVLGVGRAPALGAAIAVTLSYVLVVGPGASVVRAGVSGVVVALAWLANRPASRWHVLAVAAAACLWLDPWSVLEPGFQLSFAAVVAILTIAPRALGWLEGTSCPARLREPIAVSAACTLATAPIAWLQFDRAALLGSLPANLAALPAVAPLLWLGVAAALVHPLAPAAAVPLAVAASVLGDYLVAVARAGAWLDAVALVPVLALAALAAALTAGRRRGPVRLGLVALAVVLGATVGSRLAGGPHRVRAPPSALRVTFLDVGQGNATLLEAPGFAALVDAGPPDADVAGQLLARGVDRLDALVLSHPQADHVGGAAAVLERLQVRRVLDPQIPSSDRAELAALAAARRRDVPIVQARAGLVVRAGNVSLRVLGPRHVVPGEDPNLAAVVAVAEEGSCRVLLPADAEAPVELPLDPPRVQVLEVAHHGSADPDLPALLRTVRPALAVISVGAHNSYGHPAPATLAALAAAGVPVRRTDRDGEVEVDCPDPA